MTAIKVVYCGGSRAGFTLLEMMLVVFVIGIIAALAMPNLVIQDESQAMEESARELLTLFQLQEEEAILTGSQRGIRLFQRQEEGETSYHYQWMIWASDEGRWAEIPEQMRQLNGQLAGIGDLVLAVEGEPVDIEQELEERARPTADKDDKEDKDPPTPQAIVFSSGEFTDFEITMSSGDGNLTLVLSGSYEGVLLQDQAEMGSDR